MSTVPSWLVGYVRPSASRPPKPRKAKAPGEPTTIIGREIDEPRAWDFDGDLTRRVEVWDENWTPARLVRKCGYQRCLRCREPFFSEDCTRIRLCGVCKSAQAEPVSKPGPKPTRGPRTSFNYGKPSQR